VRSLIGILKAGLVLCLLSGFASAASLTFTANLGPNPQTGGAGKGTATITVDTAASTLTYSITYTGLSAPPAMAAFMSQPTTPNGKPGTVPINIAAGAPSPIAGSMKVTAAQVAALKAGQWWLGIGGQQGPEIGGDVTPAK